MDDAEDGDICADAERQDRDAGQRIGGTAAKYAQGVEKVSH
jgi:hypothetical protein